MTQRHYIAVDLGAESGRVMLGTVQDGTLGLQEIHRFANGPLVQNGSYRWDFPRILGEIKTGIAQAVRQAPGAVTSVAVDSWGVDFGLLDESGKLLENPYHYRDTRTDDILDEALKLISAEDIYRYSGIGIMKINTVFQLLALKRDYPETFAQARHLLLMADLVAYHLCGTIFAEYCLASTTQMMDMRQGQWSAQIMSALGLPLQIMPEIVQPGSVVGTLRDDICQELEINPIKVVAVGSHDTASAVAAVPVRSGNWAYLSSGTWSLLGQEIPVALVNDDARTYNFTNEGGVGGTIRFLKNLMGLWPIQQCRKYWKDHGQDVSYSQLSEMARQAGPVSARLDLGYQELFTPGDMPGKINQYLRQSGQKEITEKGTLVRLILQELANQYCQTLETLEKINHCKIEVLHIVGGGIKNELLCELTAAALGRKVITGPAEATAAGNIILQAVAEGQIESVAAGRVIVGNSFEVKEYGYTQRV